MAKESNVQPVKVGSLSSMYESMSHFEEKHLWTKTCKEMLLQPRNSMEDYCQQLKLNIDDTEPKRYYFCENWSECIIKPPLVTTFRNQRCRCGKLMNRVLGSSDELNLENGFVKEIASFIVSDDLYITPNGFGSSINLFQKLGIEDMEAVEERTVDISKKEVCFLRLVVIFTFFFSFLVLHSFFSLVCSFLIVGSGLAQVFIDFNDPCVRLNLTKGTISF